MTTTSAPTSARVPTRNARTVSLADDLIESFLRRHRIPGLSVAIVDQAGPLHLNGYGFADLASRAPVTPTTSYLWFSLTKIATATAALRLADVGHLDLAAPVTDFVELGPRRAGTAIPTVGQLLDHTAGFANPIPTRWVRPAARPPVDAHAFLGRQLQKHGRLKHEVGGRAHYSNLGYLVLGEVIAQVTGRSFPEHLTEAILGPAGMDHTGFVHTSPGSAATPYVRVPRPFGGLLGVLFPRELIGRRNGSYLALEPFYVDGASYGGLVGTVADAGRFASMHLADGTIDGHRILAPATARRMRNVTTPATKTGARDFGQAWFRAADHRDRQPAYAEHLGAGGGFYNAMRIYPDLNLGIVTMANTTAAYPHDVLFNQLAELGWS